MRQAKSKGNEPIGTLGYKFCIMTTIREGGLPARNAQHTCLWSYNVMCSSILRDLFCCITLKCKEREYKERSSNKKRKGKERKRVSPNHHRVSLQMHKCASRGLCRCWYSCMCLHRGSLLQTLLCTKSVFGKRRCNCGAFTWRLHTLHTVPMWTRTGKYLGVSPQPGCALNLKNVPPLEGGANVHVHKFELTFIIIIVIPTGK